MLISEGGVLEDNELMPVRSGMCLNVRVEPAPDSTLPEDPTRHLHFEDLSLIMQFSSYSSHADAPAQPANACPLNPYAHIFQPERPNFYGCTPNTSRHYMRNLLSMRSHGNLRWHRRRC